MWHNCLGFCLSVFSLLLIKFFSLVQSINHVRTQRREDKSLVGLLFCVWKCNEPMVDLFGTPSIYFQKRVTIGWCMLRNKISVHVQWEMKIWLPLIHTNQFQCRKEQRKARMKYSQDMLYRTDITPPCGQHSRN